MPKRTDSTQREVVDALRRCGVFVFSLHTVGKGCPDLLVSHPRTRRWYLIEVKNGKLSWKLNDAQKKFRALSHASVAVVTSAQEAVTWANMVSRETKIKVSYDPFVLAPHNCFDDDSEE